MTLVEMIMLIIKAIEPQLDVVAGKVKG